MRSYVSPANSLLVPDYPTSAICQSQAMEGYQHHDQIIDRSGTSGLEENKDEEWYCESVMVKRNDEIWSEIGIFLS